MPAPAALWALRDLGVRFVVSRVPLVDYAAASDQGLPPTAFPLVVRARFDDAIIYESVWSEEAEALFPRPEPPEPPEAGPVPFESAEHLEFDVMWQSGASLGLPAGNATLTASRLRAGDQGASGAAWRLEVELRTAPWVSRFFEAHDRFQTWADERLLPLRREEHLREGRRVVDRVTSYDHASGTLRIGEGPPLQLPRGARDGLAAFLYARTLPLAPGDQAQFPVSEGGRWYVVSTRVSEERIRVRDREIDVLRLEPTFSASGGRQRSLSATLFLSRDSRRLPLLVLVDAGFGSFRLELSEYHRK
jgi:hypothetical protein